MKMEIQHRVGDKGIIAKYNVLYTEHPILYAVCKGIEFFLHCLHAILAQHCLE